MTCRQLTHQAMSAAATNTHSLIQRRPLAVNTPGDRFEQEADRVADAVVSGRGQAGQFSLSAVPITRVQREDAPKAKTDEEKYQEAAGKLGEAFLATPLGKDLLEKVKQDQLVKGATEAGKSFIGTLPGKIITGAAAAGAVATLAATHKELPAQIPEIPLDVLTPGLSVEITYKGPVDKPTEAMITFKFTEQAPKGGGEKKPGVTQSEKFQAETARIAADQARFRAGMKYPPGSPEDLQQRADEEAAKRALAKYAPGPDLDAMVKKYPWLQAPQPKSGPQLEMPKPSFGYKPPALLGDEYKLKLPGEQKKKEDEPVLQRKAAADATVDVAPPVVHDVLQSPGQPLDAGTRTFMEQRFGHDFSQVRVHLGAAAEQSARAVNALAYTVGHNIVFGADRFAPGTHKGQRLLAHELTHVVQQSGSEGGRFDPSDEGNGRSPISSGAPIRLLSQSGDHAERQADQVVERVARGLPAFVGAPVLPASRLSLAPETWYRGEAEGVPLSTSTSVGGHDLGDGMYMTDDVGVAKDYAAMRVKDNKLPGSARRIMSADIDLTKVRVLDLTKDERFDKFTRRPAFPGASMTNGDLMKTQQNYPKMFQAFCEENKIKLDDYQVIIGPEKVRGGKQMCIRDPRLITEVRSSFVAAKPPSGRGGPGSGSGGGELEGEPNAPRGRAVRPGSGTDPEPTGEPNTRSPSRPVQVPPVDEEPKAGGPTRRPSGGGLGHEPGGMGPSPRRVVGNMLLHLGSGVALGLFQAWFKGKVARDLDALPKPKIDRRGAQSFLNDPKAADGAHLLDLFNKNMKPFQQELEIDNQGVITNLNLRLMALALKQDKTRQDVEARLGELDDIDDELGEYDDALSTVADNLDAILEKEEGALEAKKAAIDLRALLTNGMVLDWLIKEGFSVEEISSMDSNLAFLSASITMLFDDTRSTQALIQRLREKANTLRRASKKIWWDEFGKQVQLTIRQQEALRAQTQADARKKADASKPQPQGQEADRPVFRNSDEMGSYYGLRTRESEILREIEQMEQQTPTNGNKGFARRDELLHELAQVRQDLKRYLPKKSGFGPNDG
jgi:hypothetical protein